MLMQLLLLLLLLLLGEQVGLLLVLRRRYLLLLLLLLLHVELFFRWQLKDLLITDANSFGYFVQTGWSCQQLLLLLML
uniref:Putative secreted peptide n=1 Tax=Anopheles braziliensis TaxID=58242 RepID=A0A2M3ZN24_9DIPT